MHHTTKESDSVMRTRGSDHSDLITFVDCVIVPALVEKFLAEHKVGLPDGNTPFARPKDVA